MKQKILTMLLLAGLTASILAGCGQTENKDNAETHTTETAQSETKEEPTETPEETEETHTHNYTEAITTEPSCETDGLKTFTCECGDTYTEPISSTGHVYENYTFNNDATYSADGTETSTCICGLSDTRIAQGTKLEYTYTDMQATMYAQQTVNVRDLPSTDGNKLGSLSTNDEVKVTGQADTGWYRIEYNGGAGYVSDSYLGNNKVEVAPPTQETSTTVSNISEWTAGVYRMNYGQYEDGTYWTYGCHEPTSSWWTNICKIISYEYIGNYNVTVYHKIDGEFKYTYLTNRPIYKIHCENINCIYSMDNSL